MDDNFNGSDEDDAHDIWAAVSFFLDGEYDGGSDQATDLETTSAEKESPTQANVPTGRNAEASKRELCCLVSTRRKKARRVDRRREEILVLRRQARELENKLTLARLQLVDYTELSRMLSSEEREVLTSAWSFVATQQRHKRRESEAERERLVGLIQQQRALAQLFLTDASCSHFVAKTSTLSNDSKQLHTVDEELLVHTREKSSPALDKLG